MTCTHPGHDYETLYEVTLEPDDPLLKEATEIGIKRAKKVDPHAPGGWIRSPKVRKRRNILGALAEIVMRDILNETIKKRGIDAKIVSSAITEIQEEAEVQIDLTLKVGGQILETEVRSSCLRNPLEWGITKGVPGTRTGFDIIGWYTTRTKPKEVRKDFYLRILYNFDEKEAMYHVENGITLYFVGGASRKLLEESPEAYNTDLGQPGANYRCMKICAARDADKVLDEIFP
jgi:hypothetical protein